MNFQTVLTKHRELSFSEHDKGNRFERLMQGFLKTDPIYASQFHTVWMWDDFPYKSQFGGHDVGIDLVGLTYDNEYWAIQCKCYQADTSIDKGSVDSFLSTSSRDFVDDEQGRIRFTCRLWISTTNNWGVNAEEALKNQNPPVIRISLFDLESSPVDWDKLDKGVFGSKARSGKKRIMAHQIEALESVHTYFQTEDRGKLIMACGTGKTYTALKIAENETEGKGLILVLVPSIALMGQTLKEWYADAEKPINAVCICSDPSVSRKKKEDDNVDTSSVLDLALPASTDVNNILRQFGYIQRNQNEGMTVVFSTYQSIDVISQALKSLDVIFDLVICDEAHRTTGVTLAGSDESAFVKVHDNSFIPAKKRLYMTATPRLFNESSKAKADLNDAVLCSMDDEKLYGKEIYRLGFGQAVDEGLLTDYKVLVLTLSDKDISPSVQRMVADEDNTISADDASKLIGCVNALSKQILGDEGIIKETDPLPMKKAVAFCQNISVSREVTNYFNAVPEKYIADLPDEKRGEIVPVQSRHIDGSMRAIQRDELLHWLKEDSDECRILTNVRCLSEGVDVPSLDAVMFLSARNSKIDVVQSVGRVMRRAEGKTYGYIVIPVVIPSDVPPEKALDDNDRFKIVWDVLNALRAHDERFQATIEKIDLNKKRPTNILVGGVPSWDGEDGGNEGGASAKTIQTRLQLQFEELKDTIYARMVVKVGERQYWELWAKKVADIAEKQIGRIKRLVKNTDVMEVFSGFVSSLQENINPTIDENQAIEMLSQHMITKPVFEALFENYSFAEHNPVSKSMQKMIGILEENAFEKDTESLSKFYDSVKETAKGLDNTEARHSVIIKLYDNFFKNAFPRMVEQLGIVYTPVEVVDFIIHSVDDVLRKEFGRALTDENVNILDPFTGTGTFVTRLLESGLISQKDLPRKYSKEIFANEIVLLAYYIAAVNIENAFHAQMPENTAYQPFNGICLTDTFQLNEFTAGEHLAEEFFPKNNERANAQKKTPITVIMSNPPYADGRNIVNYNIKTVSYPKLEQRIIETYIKTSQITNKNSLYDSYIKAFRWATDRLNETQGGIICFVSNGSWIDGNATDGFRKHLEHEFSSIYVFNLRGNQRTSGELSRKEGGKIFGSGSRTPVTITLLVKKQNSENQKAVIYYHDIGDYLKREEKLEIVKNFGSVGNPEMEWVILHPNAEGDWINLRNPLFDTYIPIGDKRGKVAEKSFFDPVYSLGLATHRDIWCYSSSKIILVQKMKESIQYYNSQVDAFKVAKEKNSSLSAADFLSYDSSKFSWTMNPKNDVEKFKKYSYDETSVRIGHYRPYFKRNVYFNNQLNDAMYLLSKHFPTPETKNLIICVSAAAGKKESSALITDTIPDLHLVGDTQCFPLYYYEKAGDNGVRIHNATQTPLFAAAEEKISYYQRKDGVSDFILNKAQTQYKDMEISKEDIFYYVYGILHSKDYRTTFSNDLKKMLPRIPLVEKKEEFFAFSEAGRRLADLHLHYEKVPPYPDVEVSGAEFENFRVTQMKFIKKGDKSRIVYNSSITLSNIPEKAYEYIVNGKSAIEWIMESNCIGVDKASGIKNDANDWADEVGNPRYILDLLLSVINVSVQTVDIVDSLPKLKF